MDKDKLTLVIDTALHCAQGALFENDCCIAQGSNKNERGQAEILLPVLENMLQDADRSWKDIQNVVVTVGPGVFTGIRTGIAVARALRLALDIDVRGIGTLHLLAASAADKNKTLLALIDAHKHEAYAQVFSGGLQPLEQPALLKVSDFETQIKNADKIVAYPAAFAQQLRTLYSAQAKKIIAADKLDLAFAPQCAALQPHEPTPLYVRAPDALPQQNGLLKRA